MQSIISRRLFIERALATSTGAYATFLLGGCSGSTISQPEPEAPPIDNKSTQPSAAPAGDPTPWKRLRLGAGGYVAGISIARDGTKVVHTDTHGAYIWDEKAKIWRELFTRKTLPKGDVPHPRYYGEQSGDGRSDGPGCWEAVVAPTNSSVIYGVWNAYGYRSTDKGRSFQKTALPRVHSRANDKNFAGGIERLMGPKMAIDPANPNVVWISGDMADGLWRTDDGGATWKQNTQIPQPNDGTDSKTNLGPYLIVFDPSSPVVGGQTQGIYVASYGHGLFHSTDAGATFRFIAGAPTAFRRLTCDQLGRVWISDASTTTTPIRKYENEVWSYYGVPGVRVVEVAVNPANPAHIIGLSNSLAVIQSKDDGASWSYWFGHTNPATSRTIATATDVPWLALSANGAFISTSAGAFDPASGNFFVTTGIGVFMVDSFPDTTSTKLEFKSQSLGIEQLCVWRIMAPPGGSPITVQLDRSAMKVRNPDLAPTTYGPSLDLKDGFDLDYSLTNPNHLVVLCSKGGSYSGFSTDQGENWTYFAGKDQMSISRGGSIAVSTPENVVHIPNNNGVAKYSLDGGKTWARVNIPGLPAVDGASEGTGWGWHWAHNRKILCSDKVEPHVFYAYNYGTKFNPQLAGLWRTIDGGRNWSQVKAGTIGEWTTYHAQLNSVPDYAGHLFFTAGSEQGQPLYRSTDGGVIWKEVPGFKNVISFGFGKSAPSASYPTVFVSGWLNGVYGIWRSIDDCNTWAKIGDYPLDSIDMSPSIAGDANIFGRCYVAFGGSGAAYVDSAGWRVKAG